MVKWTDFERATIKDIFSGIDYGVVGPAALSRYLIVYPWTQRNFSSFGNLYNAAVVTSNPNVAELGIKVLTNLDEAASRLDDIEDKGAEKAVLHLQSLQVDPGNFKLLGDCLTIVIAGQMGKDFTADVQAAFQKFLNVVAFSLERQYY